MEPIIIKILTSLIVVAIIALIKLYSDVKVLNAQHDSLQEEVNELKTDAEKQFDKLLFTVDKKFDTLFEMLRCLDNVYVRKDTQ
jgi:predicted Holliday junction resolvase-like endonuclease